MLEEDPAEITVHLVQFEKDVPFCMPGAEGTNAFYIVTPLNMVNFESQTTGAPSINYSW